MRRSLSCTFSIFVLGLLSSGAVFAQATDIQCAGCVDSSDISSHAVKTGHFANGAVETRKLKNQAVTGTKIRDSAISAVKIRDGAVGGTKVDPSEVQLRVADSCAVGSFVAGIGEDGSVTCEKGGTAAVLTANGNDLTPDVAVVDQQRFWLDACLTAPYVAGPGETALVTASVGFTLNFPIQGDVIVSSFVAGVPTTYGNGYLWAGDTGWDITVVHHIDLAEGVEYRFGATIFPQGGGVTRSRLACQTMVQIVRATP